MNPAPRKAPGLRQFLPLPFGMVTRMRRAPLEFLMNGFRRFGDVFRHQVGPRVFHLVSHPEHVKHVLNDHHRNYPRSWFYNRTKVVLGNGLVSSEGAPWLRQRRMVQPAFHHQRIAGLAPLMTDATAAMLGRWRPRAEAGQPFDVAAEMIRLTLSIVGLALFGVDLGDESGTIGPAVTTLLGFLERRIGSLVALPVWLPTPDNLRFRSA
ncbi:MAG TPA: cytochrome P450, partial [Gemmataceae bacterium]|nr:cytochrome P450 [Gemmataceae bacterium]